MSTESSEESDVPSAVSPTPSRRSSRPKSRVAYSEPNYSNQSDSDGQESLKRRLDDFLGEDSGSDKEFVPTPSSKKKKRRAGSKASEVSRETDSGSDDDTRANNSENKNKKRKSEEKNTSENKWMSYYESSSDEEKRDKSKIDQKITDKSRKKKSDKKKTKSKTKQRNATKGKRSNKLTGKKKKGEESGVVVSSSDDDENVKHHKLSCIEFSRILSTPSTLKRLEGPTFISASVDPPTNPRKESAAWRCLLTQLRSSLNSLTARNQAESMFPLIRACLNTQTSSLLCPIKTRQYYENEYVNKEIGSLIIKVIMEFNTDPQITAKTLFEFGEFMLTERWRNFEPVLSEVLRHLFNLGALKHVESLVTQMNENSKFPLTSSEETFLSLARNLIEMFASATKNEEDMMSVSVKSSDRLVDDIILVTDDILSKSGTEMINFLSVYAWYIANNKDVEMAMDMLVNFRNANMSEERSHKVLIDFLTEHEFEPELILNALKVASDQFPYLPEYVIMYCQKLFQRDEDMETSFDSENENESDNTKRDELITIVEKLIKYLDFSYNKNDENAWTILLTCTHNLMRTEDGAHNIKSNLEDRKSWWLEQNTSDLAACRTQCLGHKLAFCRIITSNQTFSEKVLDELKTREAAGDKSVDRVLAQADAFSIPETLPESPESLPETIPETIPGTLTETLPESLPVLGTEQSSPEQKFDLEIADWKVEQETITKVSRREAEYLKRSVWYNKVKDVTDKVKYRVKREGGDVKKRAPKKSKEATLHAKNPTFFKNFLYMIRDRQIKLIQYYVDWHCEKVKNTKTHPKHEPKKDIHQNLPDLNTQPSSYKKSIVKVLQRNLTEEISWKEIVKQEFHLPNMERTFSYFKKVLIFRMQKCVDWSVMDNLQIPRQNKLQHKLKINFLTRFHSVSRNKLNPRLALKLVGKELQGDIRTHFLDQPEELQNQLEYLDDLIKFINKSI